MTYPEDFMVMMMMMIDDDVDDDEDDGEDRKGKGTGTRTSLVQIVGSIFFRGPTRESGSIRASKQSEAVD